MTVLVFPVARNEGLTSHRLQVHVLRDTRVEDGHPYAFPFGVFPHGRDIHHLVVVVHHFGQDSRTGNDTILRNHRDALTTHLYLLRLTCS